MNDAELFELTDERLIDYISRARKAGRADAARLAVQILAYKHERQVVGFVFNQLGSKGEEVVRQIAARTIADAIAGAESFEGRTIEEFRGFLFTIARRRRVDYLRKKRVDEVPLVNENDEDAREREFAEGGDPLVAVDAASVFNQAFGELKKKSHKLVVLLSMHGYKAKEVAEMVNRQFGDTDDDPMTDQNVNQINSRFNKRLDDLLDD